MEFVKDLCAFLQDNLIYIVYAMLGLIALMLVSTIAYGLMKKPQVCYMVQINLDAKNHNGPPEISVEKSQ